MAKEADRAEDAARMGQLSGVTVSTSAANASEKSPSN